MLSKFKIAFIACTVFLGICLGAYLLFFNNQLATGKISIMQWEVFPLPPPTEGTGQSRNDNTSNTLGLQTEATTQSTAVTKDSSPSQPTRRIWLQKVPVNQARRAHLWQTCQKNDSSNFIGHNSALESTDRFLVDFSHELMHCLIPKVATSTMERLFSVLEGNNHGISLFNISSRKIHFKLNYFTQMGRAMGAESFIRRYHVMQTFTKVIFVRDPYERIYSGYVDRLFGMSLSLPLTARDIMQRNLGNSCIPLNVTFNDVVNYVTRVSVSRMDAHFRPYYVNCFPCHLTYDYIGKLETFHADVDNIVKSLGVDSRELLGDDTDFGIANDLSILRDVSQRTFIAMRRQFFARCFTMYRALKRVWVTFQVRGYLSIKDDFPLSESKAENVTVDQFIQMVREAYLRVSDHSTVKKQRTMAMREAYYSLPRPLLYKLQRVVQRDCDLFDYQCSVDQRFNESQRPTPVFHLDQL